MKNPSRPDSPKGFTLIELLVVIAIIATLASVTFAIGPAMMNKAKQASAMATATGIANAVEQFYTDYSALPDTGSNTADQSINTNDATFLAILAGTESTPSLQNPKKIRFLTVKDAKNRMDGAIYTGNNITNIFDPWGQPYTIRLDYDYNERLEFDPDADNDDIPIPSVTLNGRKVAVYSLGVKVPADATSKSLVKTW